MELTKERLIIVIAGAVVIVIFGLYLVLYRPIVNKLRITYQECKTVEAQVSQTRETITALKAADIKKRLISEEDVSLAIDELTKRGKSQGIDFVSISPKHIEALKDIPCSVLPVEMEIESTYKDLGIFFGSLEEFQESLVVVRSFDITADSKNSQKLKAKLKLDIYCR